MPTSFSEPLNSRWRGEAGGKGWLPRSGSGPVYGALCDPQSLNEGHTRFRSQLGFDPEDFAAICDNGGAIADEAEAQNAAEIGAGRHDGNNEARREDGGEESPMMVMGQVFKNGALPLMHASQSSTSSELVLHNRFSDRSAVVNSSPRDFFKKRFL
jgi:hypothetical protein